MTGTQNFYQTNHNKGALILPGKGAAGWVSPTTGKAIDVKEVRIKSHDVMRSITKCIYNKRSKRYLKPASVHDIIGSIRANGRNSTPVLAVKLPDGRYEIITGIRRSFAVSLCEGAELIIHYADSMTEDDKRILARTADTYDTPSIIDFGLTLLEFRDQIGAEAYSVRVAAEAYGENKTLVSDAMRAAALPADLLNLFPGLGFVSRTFLRSVTAKDITHELIISAIKGIEAIDVSDTQLFGEDAAKSIKSATDNLEKEVLRRLKLVTPKGNRPQSKIAESWSTAVFHQGVTTTVSARAVTIKLDSKLANSEVGQALIKLLSEQSAA